MEQGEFVLPQKTPASISNRRLPPLRLLGLHITTCLGESISDMVANLILQGTCLANCVWAALLLFSQILSGALCVCAQGVSKLSHPS